MKNSKSWLILMICTAAFLNSNHVKAVEQNSIAEGIAYIESMEQKETAEIEEEIKEIKRQERQKAMENGELSVWDQFYDSIIMGDSRCVGLTEYELLDSQHVIANPGDRIDVIPEYIDTIAMLNPEKLFLCYGLNDVMGYYAEPSEFTEKYNNILKQVKERLPDVEIYINSILPVQDIALYQNAGFSEIESYNEALRILCENNGYIFIDNTQTVQEHMDLYEDDGIHLMKDFYEYWLMNMINGVEVE
ncbi:MAG: GDSL-type esterase/lipase family protein [Eubacteriales bacterium]|nr:GDSL-type esterase/lipase family protein [Eubacteriales bacterium]